MFLVRLLVVAGALIIGSGPAVADLFEWNTTGSLSAGSGTMCIDQKCKTTFTSLSGSKTLTAKAYSTKNVYDSSNPTSISGTWIEAEIALYSGGIGIKNTVAGDLYESNQPEHGVDNQQIHDIVAFEFATGAWTPDSFKLGYINTDSDVQAWVGGTSLGANYDFKNVCFTGCANTLDSLGFTKVSKDNVALNTNTSFGFDANTTGRYLIMAGNLGDGSVTGFNDHFKLSKLSGTTPVPGTLVLLGLGLLVLAYLRQRPLRLRAAAARRSLH